MTQERFERETLRRETVRAAQIVLALTALHAELDVARSMPCKCGRYNRIYHGCTCGKESRLKEIMDKVGELTTALEHLDA